MAIMEVIYPLIIGPYPCNNLFIHRFTLFIFFFFFSLSLYPFLPPSFHLHPLLPSLTLRPRYSFFFSVFLFSIHLLFSFFTSSPSTHLFLPLPGQGEPAAAQPEHQILPRFLSFTSLSPCFFSVMLSSLPYVKKHSRLILATLPSSSSSSSSSFSLALLSSEF